MNAVALETRKSSSGGFFFYVSTIFISFLFLSPLLVCSPEMSVDEWVKTERDLYWQGRKCRSAGAITSSHKKGTKKLISLFKLGWKVKEKKKNSGAALVAMDDLLSPRINASQWTLEGYLCWTVEKSHTKVAVVFSLSDGDKVESI